MDKKILIVEDEPIIAMDLESTLEKLGFAVAGIAAEGRQAIEQARQFKPDLILMDIQIEGPLTGIDVAKIIGVEMNIPVIFLTSQIDAATIAEALIARPSGYIVKPFDETELFANIELALFKKKNERGIDVSNDPEYLFIKDESRIIKIYYKDIIYLESAENYVNILTIKEKILVRNTLSNLETSLAAKVFMRSHKSFIVKIEAIKSIHQNLITLENGQVIPLGRSYKQAFLEGIQIT